MVFSYLNSSLLQHPLVKECVCVCGVQLPVVMVTCSDSWLPTVLAKSLCNFNSSVYSAVEWSMYVINGLPLGEVKVVKI